MKTYPIFNCFIDSCFKTRLDALKMQMVCVEAVNNTLYEHKKVVLLAEGSQKSMILSALKLFFNEMFLTSISLRDLNDIKGGLDGKKININEDIGGLDKIKSWHGIKQMIADEVQYASKCGHIFTTNEQASLLPTKLRRRLLVIEFNKKPSVE